jgi:hypothetical protein
VEYRIGSAKLLRLQPQTWGQAELFSWGEGVLSSRGSFGFLAARQEIATRKSPGQAYAGSQKVAPARGVQHPFKPRPPAHQ